MAGFDRYPGVDVDNNFPAVIRAALAASPEVSARFTSTQGTIDAIANTRQAYSYRWADATARGNQTGMRKYDSGTQLDTGQRYEYTGTEWIVRATAIPIMTAAERTAMLTKLPVGVMALDPTTGITYRLSRLRVNGVALPVEGSAAATPTYDWVKWDSDWFAAIPTITGLTGTAFGSPGWLPGGHYKYVGGLVRYHFGFSLNSAMTPGGIGIALPVPANRYGLFNSGSGGIAQDGLATTGRIWRNGAKWYDHAVTFASATTLGVMNVNGAQYMDGQGGGAWAQSESLVGVIEYEHY